MKKYIFLSVFLVFGQITNAQNYFHLNTNPQNPNRVIDWEKEELVILDKDSPTRILGGANGKKSSGIIPSGVAVVINKQTKESIWVRICGNLDITGDNWKPSGKIISQAEYKKACKDILNGLYSLEEGIGNLQEGINELLKRDYSGSFLELRSMLNEAIKNNNACLTTPNPLPSEWTTSKTFGVIGGAALGAAIGGFGFSQKYFEKIDPSFVESGNGTRQYGPEKFKEKEKFNLLAAGSGAVIGGILTYLILR